MKTYAEKIKQTVFNLVDFTYDGVIEVKESDGVSASLKNGVASVGGASKCQLARAFFLFAKNVSEGKTSFEINQKPQFEDCGAMLDMSRNGVMTVDAVKRYIDYMAALGMNMLMLYTEDTYEIEEYPYFGYLRGRYSQEELKEIVEYGEEMGIELIPCIQTLAHLTTFLKWAASAELCDTLDILLIDSEKTYQFIECAISALRKAFKTSRIHIGMDEARFVGLGNYFDKHGFCNRFELLNRHLTKVVDICSKYGFKPMIWGDMYFRLGSKTHAYFEKDFHIADEIVEQIPDVKIVYWDYSTLEEETYNMMIKNHYKLKKPLFFAGGLSTWTGFLTNYNLAYRASCLALTSCIKNGIKNVFATMWGDDGCETNQFFALSLLPLYSEYCYHGIDCTDNDIISTAEFLTKIPHDAARAAGNLHIEYEPGRYSGKSFIWGDILYDLGTPAKFCDNIKVAYGENKLKMQHYMAAHDKNFDYYNFAYLVYSVAEIKCDFRINLRKAYQSGDTEYLNKAVYESIPILLKHFDDLYKLHKKLWKRDYKPFGWEVISFRYGGVVNRLKEAEKLLKAYLNGEISRIDELEETILLDPERGKSFLSITPSMIF